MLLWGIGEEATGPIPNPLSGAGHETMIREVWSVMASPRACRSLKGARPMYPKGFEDDGLGFNMLGVRFGGSLVVKIHP